MEKRIPKVRFEGYDTEWEVHSVGDLLCERNIQSPKSDEYPLMAFIANEGVAPKGERYDRSSLVSDVENKLYKQTEYGDFIYSSNNLEAGSIGLNKYGKACISPVYSIFFPTELGDSEFLGRRLVTKDFINDMVKWRQGVVYGQWRIHETDFLKIEVSTPKIDEQRRIGAFLNEIDELIKSHQKKYKILINLRKSMLKKMFPQDNQNTPDIRFDGFTDAWKLREIGEIGSILTCKRIFKEQTAEKGDIPFYKNGTLGLKADAFIARDVYEEYKRLYPFPKVGDVLISVVGSIGRTAEYTGKDEYFQDSNIVWLDTDGDVVDKKYLQVSYKVIKWNIEGSTIKHLYNDNILTSKIWLPTIEEQKKIGRYFYSLDLYIAEQEKQILKLKNMKSACMKKMFV